MPRVLRPILARFRRAAATPPRRAADRPDVRDDRGKARALADAIDRAMQMGLWEHAGRLARTAARLAPQSSRLSERLARLRLACNDPETALAIIDGCRETTASLRMLRAACLIQRGHKQEAHADLLRWSKRSASPLDARLMLALLEWESGDHHTATLTLMRNLKHLEDPRTLELLLLIAVAQDRHERARFWAQRLHEVSAFGAGSKYVELLTCSLHVPPRHGSGDPTEAQVNRLSLELISAEQVIPSLVASQRLHGEPAVVTLLYRAIEKAVGDLSDKARAAEALAKLALLLEDLPAAERWARVGLQHNPLSATLTMLLGRLQRASQSREFDGGAECDAGDIQPMEKAA